ncbi:Rio2, N-terminal [Musa troglodytarum]|uniref:non-specific serine/threonine protein kinase n=1 Tax=Musa troglodytarum TaxID=320322 RepID=A0A9E7E9W7_9LILI|nr:Rio2, N-terminal [Musa troglodytarum]
MIGEGDDRDSRAEGRASRDELLPIPLDPATRRKRENQNRVATSLSAAAFFVRTVTTATIPTACCDEARRGRSADDFRVLTAVEMGMRNHEIVPAELVDRIAGLKHGGTYKVLKNLLKHKLVHHDSSKCKYTRSQRFQFRINFQYVEFTCFVAFLRADDGFRLTYLGYDFLAIKALVNRGVFAAVGRQIGVGKESDIFEVAAEDGTIMVMKLHRLGRVSFRAVKSKRDYLKHRSSYNWLYLSRLAALKEYAFMKALGEHGFPVPDAVDCNRHCVVMSLVQGYPLVQVKRLQNPDEVLETIVDLVVRLAEHGLIHCDFNEFNIMIDDNEQVTMIDFPQMVSVSHRNAKMYFDRDVECIFKFFSKRFNLSYQEAEDGYDETEADVEEIERPSFSSIAKTAGFLDKELSASGFTRKDQDDIEKFIEGGTEQKDTTSSDDELEDQEQTHIEATDDSVAENIDFLDLEDQEDAAASCNVSIQNEDKIMQSGEKENSDEADDGDAELTKRLNKQRRRAIAASQGTRKALSRNFYKDKGGKSAHNSKIQRQSCKW